MSEEISIRRARPDDFHELAVLQDAAFTNLLAEFYRPEDIACVLATMPLLTPALILEGHYFVATGPGDRILASGGWSRAAPGYATQGTPLPAPGEALVRAVLVRPDVARCGLGRRIMAEIESDAAGHGISVLGLTATAAGEALYRRLGYTGLRQYRKSIANGGRIALCDMRKHILPDLLAAA